MLLETTKNSREIKTEYLRVHGNCMEIKDTIIQLSNVSLITTTNPNTSLFPFWNIALFAIGSWMLSFLEHPVIILFGLIFIFYSWYIVYKWYEKGKQKNLIIVTNSGNSFIIAFTDRSFLEKILQVLKTVISNPGHLSDVTINIQGNSFVDSSVIHDYEEIHF